MPVCLSCNYTHKSLAPLLGVEVDYHSVSISVDEVLGFFLKMTPNFQSSFNKVCHFKEIIIK